MIRDMKTQIIEVRTGNRETVSDITRRCAEFAGVAADGGDGLLHVFVPHATAGIALIELGARSDDDLLAALADLLPADDRWRHAHGSRGHGRSHVMPAFVPPYATVPVIGEWPGPRHLAIHRPGRPQRRQPGPSGPAVIRRLMGVLVEGSGRSSGWPNPGAGALPACGGHRRDVRKRSAIVVDGRCGWGPGTRGGGPGPRGPGTGDGGGDGAAGYRVRRVADIREGGAGGWDVTTPDGERLLYPGGPGAVPAPPEGAAPYDVAFLDLLGDPAQLGWLRARGLISAGTVTAVAFADHRVPSERELARRCGFWRVRLVSDGEAVARPVRIQKVRTSRPGPGGCLCWAGHVLASRSGPSCGWRASRR